MSKRFKNMEEVDDYLEKQIQNERFYLGYSEYETYFIDRQQEYADEDEAHFKIDGFQTMSNEQVLELLNENEQLKEQLQMIKEIIQTQITETEEYLQTSIKGGMPTGSLYSEIELLQKLKKECFDE